MGIRLKVLLSILCVVLAYGFYYLAIPRLLNLEDTSPVISRYIKQEYGFNVKLKNPIFKMGYLPSVWVNADSFEILNDDATRALFINKPVVKVSLIPLIFNRLNVRYFSSKNIYADVFCDDRLNVALGQYKLIKMSDVIFDLNDSKVYVDSFNINLTDKIKNEKIFIEGKYFNIDRFNKNKYLKASTNFDISNKEKKSSVLVNIDTKLPFNSHMDDYPPELSVSAANLNIAAFANYISYFTKGEVSDISGVVNIDIHSNNEIFGQKLYVSDILIDNFFIKTKLFEKDYYYPRKIAYSANYLLKGDTLNIPYINVKTSKFKINLSGAINKVSANRPVPNLLLKINNARAEDLLEIMPYCNRFDKLAKIYVTVIKNAGFFADVNVNLKITDNFITPLLYGDINVTNAYVTRPIYKAPKNADIKIKYIGKKLQLLVDVPTDLAQFVKVEGLIDAYGDNYADLHITSSNLVDLSEAERILMPVHKAFDFLLGPVPIMGFSGFGSIDLIVKGTKKDAHTFGWFKTKSATTYFDEIKNLILTNADSALTFDDTNTKFVLESGLVNGKPVKISGTCNLFGEFNFNADFSNQNAGYLLNVLKTSSMLEPISKNAEMFQNADGTADLKLNIFGHLLDINELNFGKNVHAKGELVLKSVKTRIKNTLSYLQNINGLIKFDDYKLILDLASVIGESKMVINGEIKDNNAKISFNTQKTRLADLLRVFPSKFIKLDSISASEASFIDLSGKYSGSVEKINADGLKLDGHCIFKNLNLIYVPLKMPIKLNSGKISIKNSSLSLNRISGNIGTMPTLLGGKVTNIFEKPYMDISVYTKPNQKFIDFAYNSKVLYPVKIKGKVTLSALIWGSLDRLNIKSNLNFDKHSSLYYMGGSVSSGESPLFFNFDSLLEPNRITVKNFIYEKKLSSGAILRQLTASGQLISQNSKTFFNNFKIKTFAPTDVKLFNVMFKKPFIKKGVFTSNLILNGSTSEPEIRGDFGVSEVDIPFLDASVKKISLKFLQNNIIAAVNGSAFDNDFTLNIDALNRFKTPYVINRAKLDAGKLNINTLYNAINESSIVAPISSTVEFLKNPFDIKDLHIKNLNIIAEEVFVKDTSAKSLSADVSLNNGNLKVDRFKFNLAKGQMDGYVSHNINSKTSAFDLNVVNVDANELAKSLFELDGQIFGDLNGQINLGCNGNTQMDCLKTLDGRIVFQVKDGKMPKLGSLEYLLRAGNLIKSGITGLSVNSIIELVNPLKTGSFEQIKGTIAINKGVADKIQIVSEGKELNLFIIGEYNLTSKFADMFVFGRLARKVSNILGPVGNVSLNTLFNTIPGVNLSNTKDTGLVNSINKIPGLELSSKIYRVFAAEIHGDISGDEYVESFRWIE